VHRVHDRLVTPGQDQVVNHRYPGGRVQLVHRSGDQRRAEVVSARTGVVTTQGDRDGDRDGVDLRVELVVVATQPADDPGEVGVVESPSGGPRDSPEVGERHLDHAEPPAVATLAQDR
jgi:uncharacterized protein RhaS with RHS repeats